LPIRGLEDVRFHADVAAKEPFVQEGGRVQRGRDAVEQKLRHDDPETFAESCCTLYADEELWQRQRANALDRIGVDCSREAFRTALKRALDGKTPV